MVRRHKEQGARYKAQTRRFLKNWQQSRGFKMQGMKCKLSNNCNQRIIRQTLQYATLVPCTLHLLLYLSFFILTISILVSLTLMISNS